MTSPFTVQERRTPMACTNCRLRKTKCRPVSQAQCEQCKKKGLECEYKPVAGSSEAQIASMSHHPQSQSHAVTGTESYNPSSTITYPLPSNAPPANMYNVPVSHVAPQDVLSGGHPVGQSTGGPPVFLQEGPGFATNQFDPLFGFPSHQDMGYGYGSVYPGTQSGSHLVVPSYTGSQPSGSQSPLAVPLPASISSCICDPQSYCGCRCRSDSA